MARATDRKAAPVGPRDEPEGDGNGGDGRLSVGRARIRRLYIDELTVGRIRLKRD